MSEYYNFLRSFTFNEKETKHLFQIAQVRLPFLSKDNEYLKIGNADGKYYKSSSLGDLTISIDGFIIEDNSKMSVSDTIDELVKIVNSDEPKRLVLDALDDRYFLATFNGTQEYDATNLKYTPLTLNFDVPESFARAISINGYTNTTYGVVGNMVFDSEFKTREKFWKPFAYKIDETFVSAGVKRAWSWSSDGTDRFTTKYPNENLIVSYETISNSYLTENGVQLPTANAYMTGKIKVNPDEYYTIKNYSQSKTCRIMIYDSDSVRIFRSDLVNISQSFKMPVSSDYMIAQFDNTGGKFENNAKIEKSTEPTIYTPSPKDDYENAYPKYEGYYSSNEPVQSTKPSDYEWFPVGTPTKYSSNILQANFTQGYPVGTEYGLNYMQVTPNTRRLITGIKKGDKVAGKVFYRFKELGIDLTNVPDDTIVATVHLDEVGGTPFSVKHIHTVDVTKKDVVLNEFKELGAIFTIQSDETTHINLTYGFMGLSIFEISKPLLIYKPSETNISDVPYVESKVNLTETITVSNKGTYRTPITADFTINGDSGLVGLLNGSNGGVLQFGNAQDVDGKASKKNENVLELNFNGTGNTGFDYINSEFTTYYPKLYDTQVDNVFSGSFDMSKNFLSATPVFSTGTPLVSWNGPSGVSNVPVGLSNNRGQAFGFFTRIEFNDKNLKDSRGRIECAVMDNTGKPYINIVLRDSSATSSNMYLEGIYKGVKVWEIPINKNNIKTTKFELTIMRQDTYIKFSLLEIKTMGTTTGGTSGVTSSYKDYTFYYNLTEPDTTPVYKVGTWFMRYSNTKSTTIMLLDDMQFRWYNTDVWTNISNTFKDGDNVTIDVATRSLYINGSLNTDLNVLGNEWNKFYLELGDTQIQPIVSSFSNTPLVVINTQDRFI